MIVIQEVIDIECQLKPLWVDLTTYWSLLSGIASALLTTIIFITTVKQRHPMHGHKIQKEKILQKQILSSHTKWHFLLFLTISFTDIMIRKPIDQNLHIYFSRN